MQDFLDSVRRFREFLLEVGVGQNTLALPTPRMLALAAPENEPDPQKLFSFLIVEPEIIAVARDLFVSGHFSLAIQEAFKALEKYVQSRAGTLSSGTALMEQVFSPKNPQLFWSNRVSQSELDEQVGYHRIFSGAVQGIRNPCVHEFNWVDDPETALELLSLIQHLIRRTKSAQVRSHDKNSHEDGNLQ